jgi:3-methyladenine DNA glycosylase AlkD
MLALIRGVRDKRPDLERVERFTASMLHEQEFFIRKAIGWLLRELATREPAFVRRWIATYGDRASGLTLREASRKLPNEAGEGA